MNRRRRRGRIAAGFFFLTGLLSFLIPCPSCPLFPTAHAVGNFCYAIEGSTAPGKNLYISLILPEGTEALSGMRAGICCSSGDMECVSVQRNSSIPKNALYSYISGQEVSCVYAAPGGEAAYLSGTILRFCFRSNESTSSSSGEEIVFHLWADQFTDENGEPLWGNMVYEQEIRLPPAEFSGGLLTSLEPSCGTLSPAFSPETLYYLLSVPTNTKEIYFTASPENDSSVSVSRKTLNPAGSSTEIRITLTAPSGGKTVYTVCVFRSDLPLSAGIETSDPDESFNYEQNSLPPSQSMTDSFENPPLNVVQNNFSDALLLLCVFFSGGSFLLFLLLYRSNNKRKTKGTRKLSWEAGEEERKKDSLHPPSPPDT